jgi:hypothetical protein
MSLIMTSCFNPIPSRTFSLSFNKEAGTKTCAGRSNVGSCHRSSCSKHEKYHMSSTCYFKLITLYEYWLCRHRWRMDSISSSVCGWTAQTWSLNDEIKLILIKIIVTFSRTRHSALEQSQRWEEWWKVAKVSMRSPLVAWTCRKSGKWLFGEIPVLFRLRTPQIEKVQRHLRHVQ